MTLTVAIVGTGPTGLYTLKALVMPQTEGEGPVEPATIWLFEKSGEPGVGMPYSEATASKTMLANIASIEIPPVTQTYLDWMENQPAEVLRAHGVEPGSLDERQFTPRLLLGRYYADEFAALVAAGRAAGHQIEVHARTEIIDLRDMGTKLALDATDGPVPALFDRVVLATGHLFPVDEIANSRYFPNPWSGLLDAEIPAARVGIMGTSLSAIDAAMAVANQHGRFRPFRDPDAGSGLVFEPGTDGLRITLMSRTGTLPEADFYCPIPYEPLVVMTEARLAALQRGPGLLDRVFDLVRQELELADPRYAAAVDLAAQTADSFADAYFAERRTHDTFAWAAHNLREVEENKAARVTVPWRYAILRMHEQVESIVEDLDPEDRERFDTGLKAVFVDNYAAVPSESIRRLLALRDARILDLLRLGEDYDKDHGAQSTVIRRGEESHEFDVFIDARGQRPLTASDLPLPTLAAALLADGDPLLEVDEDYALAEGGAFAGRVMFGSIPYLMHDRPFIQGIVAAAEIGETMARAIRLEAREQQASRRRRRRRAA